MTTSEKTAATGEGIAPRELETKTCSRCGGSGKMPFAVFNGVCFKCLGVGKLYTKRGHAAHAFLQRLRERRLSEIRPGMLVFEKGFSCGSVNVPSKFCRVVSIGPTTSLSKSGDGPWRYFGFELTMTNQGQTHVHSGLTADSLLRVGLTARGKSESLKLALDYQDELTKSGTLRKSSTFPTAEEWLAGIDTSSWIVGSDRCWPLALVSKPKPPCRTLALRLPDLAQVMADNSHFVTTPVCVGVFELPQGSADRRDFGMTHVAKFQAYCSTAYHKGIAEAGYFYTPRHTTRANPYHKHTLSVTRQGWSLGYN